MRRPRTKPQGMGKVTEKCRWDGRRKSEVVRLVGVRARVCWCCSIVGKTTNCDADIPHYIVSYLAAALLIQLLDNG